MAPPADEVTSLRKVMVGTLVRPLAAHAGEDLENDRRTCGITVGANLVGRDGAGRNGKQGASGWRE